MNAKYTLGLVAGAGLAIAGTAQAQTLTFDLSGYTVAGIQQVFGSSGVGAAGVFVTDISWNINYSSLSGSWSSELSLELVGPGATANTPHASSAITGGWYAGTPGNAGTFIWGALAAPWNTSGAFNAGGDANSYGWTAPNSTAAFSSSGALSTHAAGASLLGASATGNWTLNIFDGYQDTGPQGQFGSGSFITIAYAVPAPGAFALLGVAGAFGARRRRA